MTIIKRYKFKYKGYDITITRLYSTFQLYTITAKQYTEPRERIENLSIQTVIDLDDAIKCGIEYVDNYSKASAMISDRYKEYLIKRTRQQTVYKFKNNYGASVIYTPYSYGTELAVLKFEDNNKFKLVYNALKDNHNDVYGHIKDEAELEMLLTKIKYI